jgi:purine nucleoside phosphorylase
MRMIVTNAAGGLNPDYVVGDIVLLNDVRQPRSLPILDCSDVYQSISSLPV